MIVVEKEVQYFFLKFKYKVAWKEPTHVKYKYPI